MGDLYLWVKVLHVLGVISWMAGLFYLPRIFVYHAERGGERELDNVFGVMEQRLLRVIMRPAGLVSVGSGLGLVWLGGWTSDVPVWLWAKLGLVFGMVLFHGALEIHGVRFESGRESAGGRYFRIMNEIPTVLLIGIVVFVVVKPF